MPVVLLILDQCHTRVHTKKHNRDSRQILVVQMGIMTCHWTESLIIVMECTLRFVTPQSVSTVDCRWCCKGIQSRTGFILRPEDSKPNFEELVEIIRSFSKHPQRPRFSGF